ncbi:hypothetical protein OC834_007355 [Tilletia horrida]|nr:hypothetical protein OC834_007355 [Tilletia horrida]
MAPVKALFGTFLPTFLGSLALLASTASAGPIPNNPTVGTRAGVTTASIQSSSYIVQTTLGPAKGTASGSGAARFTLPYAKPPVGGLRFANPQPPASFNGTYDASATPPSCYGFNGARGGNSPSEDCLYLNVYAPTSACSTSNLGVLVWIHGGSFIGGSSTNAGLDASALATKQNLVIVTLQYRLGLFGFFQNAALLDEQNGGGANSAKVAGNQAVRDVVAALSFVKSNIANLGGNPGAITVAGQSSGAHLVRTLLTIPSASSLFARAAIFSDPEDYGLANATQAAALTNYALEGLGCAPADLECARAQSASDILGASLDAFSNLPASGADPSLPAGEPFRPVFGSYIPRSLERGLAARTVSLSKPVLFSTVKNEAGSQVGTLFEPTSAGDSTLTLRANGYPLDLATAAGLAFNAGRGQKAVGAAAYAFNTSSSGADSLRSQLELISTDGLWRCATQTNAINAQKTGAKVWLAQTNIGATYPSNANIDYCLKPGVVCHEDDIFLLFGTYPSSSSTTAIRAVSAEWQARLASFVRSGSPNAAGYASWAPVSGAQGALNVLMLGANAGTGASAVQQTQRKGVCGNAGLWGQSIQFDWQLYHA